MANEDAAAAKGYSSSKRVMKCHGREYTTCYPAEVASRQSDDPFFEEWIVLRISLIPVFELYLLLSGERCPLVKP